MFIGLVFINSELAWRFIGLVLLLIGVFAILKKQVSFDLENNSSAFQIKGWRAIFIGMFMFVIGFSVLVNPDYLNTMFGLCDGLCNKTLR